MRKLAMMFGILLLLSAPIAYAHLTGAFADFLISVHDEQTTVKLKTELERTKAEIEALAPQVGELERQYGANRETASRKLRLYGDMGLDSWLGLLLQAQEPVDVLANQRLAERHLEAYLRELDELYTELLRLSATQQTLEGHRRLLSMIEQNLNARQAFLAASPDVSLEQLANYLDIDWMSEVEPHLLRSLEQDRELADSRLEEWAAANSGMPGAPYRLEEQWLNDRSGLDYFFRPDHVYVVYRKKDIHVILIGQVLSGSGGAAELQFEAGFFNGFLMPDTLIEELQGFRIARDKLLALAGVGTQAYLQQSGGALLLRTHN
ncbi:hypothetical protein [Paenibacillus sp. y28]|uniref:hypothetical protein n=1 Tax=Paenibacillus sp. y28 TaxID=3129110 RepID=UPI003015FF10